MDRGSVFALKGSLTDLGGHRVILAQVVFQAASNIPADLVVNTFHFERPVLPGTDYDDVVNHLTEFYTEPAGGVGNKPLVGYMSKAMKPEVLVKMYDLNDPKPRVPVLESSFTTTFGNQDPLPAEVALCCSFQAERQSGVAQARRRNRIYLGNLNTTANAAGRPLEGLMTAANLAMDRMSAYNGWRWRVHSQYGGTNMAVDNGWVDNAFDTQRRRGPIPTSRKTFKRGGPLG